MNAYPSTNRKSIRASAWVCGLFFWIFGIVYLGLFQGDLLSLRADWLFSGNMQYNQWIGAVIITFILWLLQRVIAGIGRFGPKWYAFSFLPSFVLLGGITYYPQDYSLPLAVCVFAGALFISLIFFALWGRKSTKLSVISNVNICLQELLLFVCLTVAIGNTDENLHHELSMGKAIGKGDYAEVLKIGKNSLSVSPKMADYRIRAMISTGQLGNVLFDYPQPFVTLPALSNAADTMGYRAFEEEIARKLLKKDLEGIHELMNKNGELSAKAGKYCHEAMLLYGQKHPESTYGRNDEGINSRFRAFKDLRALLKADQNSFVVEKNVMRREYGTSYWYYYYYNN